MSAALAGDGQPIPFGVARAFRMLFGTYQGSQLDKIAETDRGLLYLDWMRGELERVPKRSTRQQLVLDHIAAYLNDSTIAIAVHRAIRKREEQWG